MILKKDFHQFYMERIILLR